MNNWCLLLALQFSVSPSSLGCPSNVIDPASIPTFPAARERYEIFKSHFEPATIASTNSKCRAYRFSCCKENSKAYILTLIEEKKENQIIKQEFDINWKMGYPLWVKSEKISKRRISKFQMQKLTEFLSVAFHTKSRMGVPGISGHFWLENASSKETTVMDLYSERFKGEENFLKVISKYVPYLPEMPEAFYIQTQVVSPSRESL